MNTLKNPTSYIACLAAGLTIVSTSAQAETLTRQLRPETAKSTPVTAVHPLLIRRAEVRAAASLKPKSWAPMNKVGVAGVKVAAPSSDHWFPMLRTHVPVVGAPALRARPAMRSLMVADHSGPEIAATAHVHAAAMRMNRLAPTIKVIALHFDEVVDIADFMDMWESFEANGSQGFDPDQIEPRGEPVDGR